jgi:hypothetical protein
MPWAEKIRGGLEVGLRYGAVFSRRYLCLPWKVVKYLGFEKIFGRLLDIQKRLPQIFDHGKVR